MAALYAGIPNTASVNTVNRQCSSGLTAVNQIANEIKTGQIDIGIGKSCEFKIPFKYCFVLAVRYTSLWNDSVMVIVMITKMVKAIVMGLTDAFLIRRWRRIDDAWLRTRRTAQSFL